MFVHFAHSFIPAWHTMLTSYLLKGMKVRHSSMQHTASAGRPLEGLRNTHWHEQARTHPSQIPLRSHKVKKWCLLPCEALQLVQEEIPSN